MIRTTEKFQNDKGVTILITLQCYKAKRMLPENVWDSYYMLRLSIRMETKQSL